MTQNAIDQPGTEYTSSTLPFRSLFNFNAHAELPDETPRGRSGPLRAHHTRLPFVRPQHSTVGAQPPTVARSYPSVCLPPDYQGPWLRLVRLLPHHTARPSPHHRWLLRAKCSLG